MGNLSQHIIAKELKTRYDYISLLEAVRYIKAIYGSIFSIKDIKNAYKMVYPKN